VACDAVQEIRIKHRWEVIQEEANVSFSEDQSHKRDGYAAQNFSLLNRIALNLVKNEQSKKRSVKGKRLDAGWNNDYLLKILLN
jgi:hypothetical protein